MKIYICILVLIINSINALAQKINHDTVYYSLDTAKTPVNDKMWSFWKEGKITGYFLNCHCNPEQSNPVFSYKNKVGTKTKKQIADIKFISLNDLINITAQYGANKIGPTVWYFIEPKDNQFLISEMQLLWYRKPRSTYN